MKEENSTVFDLTDNPKNAALYFDYVIPVNYKAYITNEMRLYIKELLPDGMTRDGLKFTDVSPTITKEDLNTEFMNYISALYELLKDAYFPVVLPAINDNVFSKHLYNTISMKLTSLSLVNTNKTSWEHIIKFRNDKNSVIKLRKLKLFVHENYTGKDRNYIEDDLLQRLDDYKNVVKDWGFETIISSFSLLSISKTLFPTIASSLALSLFGQSLEAVVASTAGATIELGKISLHLFKERRKLATIQRDHPLAYIIEAKKKLEK